MSDGSNQQPAKPKGTPPVSVIGIIVAGVLAMFCCCSGTVSTVVAGIDSQNAGTTAAMLAGPAIGFGLGALAGSLVSHFAFVDKGDDLAFRVGIPLAGAMLGALGLGLISVVFFGIVFPAL